MGWAEGGPGRVAGSAKASATASASAGAAFAVAAAGLWASQPGVQCREPDAGYGDGPPAARAAGAGADFPGGVGVVGRLLRKEDEGAELRAMEAAGVQLAGWRDRIRVFICETKQWLHVLWRVAKAFAASKVVSVACKSLLPAAVPPVAGQAVSLLYSTYLLVELVRASCDLFLARLLRGSSLGEDAARVRRVYVRVDNSDGALSIRSPTALDSYLASLVAWPSGLTRILDRKHWRSLDERIAGIYFVRTDSLPEEALPALLPLSRGPRAKEDGGVAPTAVWTEIKTAGGGLKVRSYEAFPSTYQGVALVTISTLMYMWRQYFGGGERDDSDPFG